MWTCEAIDAGFSLCSTEALLLPSGATIPFAAESRACFSDVPKRPGPPKRGQPHCSVSAMTATMVGPAHRQDLSRV